MSPSKLSSKLSSKSCLSYTRPDFSGFMANRALERMHRGNKCVCRAPAGHFNPFHHSDIDQTQHPSHVHDLKMQNSEGQVVASTFKSALGFLLETSKHFSNFLIGMEPECIVQFDDLCDEAIVALAELADGRQISFGIALAFELALFADRHNLRSVLRHALEQINRYWSTSTTRQYSRVDLLNISRRLPCVFLRQRALLDVMQNIQDHLEDEFEADDLEIMAQDDELNLSEDRLWMWIEQLADDDQLATATRMARHLRMDLITPSIHDRVCSHRLWSLVPSSSERLSSLSARCSSMSLRSSSKPRGHTRVPSDLLLILGGWIDRGPSSWQGPNLQGWVAPYNGPARNSELLDIRANSWLQTLKAPFARAYHGLEVIYEDKPCTKATLYTFGGYDGRSFVSSTFKCELEFPLCPRTKIRWTEVKPMHERRCYLSSVRVGKFIVVMGGHDGREEGRLDTAELYDPENNVWLKLPLLLESRSDAAAVAVGTRVYVLGGFNGKEVLVSTEFIDIENCRLGWQSGPRLISPRSGVKAVVMQNNIYVIGGFDGTQRLRTMERLDLGNIDQGFQVCEAQMITRRSNHNASVVDGQIVVSGGFQGHHVTSEVERFYPETNGFTSVQRMHFAKSAHAGVVLSNSMFGKTLLRNANAFI